MTARLRAIAKRLRRQGTGAENLLWNHLRAKQINGLRFRRQEPVGQYIVDFLSYEIRMVIEVDGGQHTDQKQVDKERDNWLASKGLIVELISRNLWSLASSMLWMIFFTAGSRSPGRLLPGLV